MNSGVDTEPMIRRYGRTLDVDSPVTAAIWAGREAAVACGDGSVRWLTLGGEEYAVAAHDGAVLCAVADPGGRGALTGGDDGRVLRITPGGEVSELGRFRGWVEHLAASATSAISVAAVGREAIVWKGNHAPAHRFTFPSTIGGLALDGKGRRLAASHYGGASLVLAASAQAKPQLLPWGGSHLHCTFRPQGDYVVTATQELGLHGWKLAERKSMAMNGYRAKTRSFSWDDRARRLATSGDDQVIIWPFEGKDGPMGKSPLIVGARESTVTQVAFQPGSDMLAVGYRDGAIHYVRLADDAHLEVEVPGGGAVTALVWNANGSALIYGRDDGRVGLLDMTAKAAA